MKIIKFCNFNLGFYRLYWEVHSGISSYEGFTVLQDIPYTIPPDIAVALHKKPASSKTSSTSCYTQTYDKRDIFITEYSN